MNIVSNLPEDLRDQITQLKKDVTKIVFISEILTFLYVIFNIGMLAWNIRDTEDTVIGSARYMWLLVTDIMIICGFAVIYMTEKKTEKIVETLKGLN